MNAAITRQLDEIPMTFLNLEEVPTRSFALSDERAPFETEAHTHSRHQLLYAVSGTLHLSVNGARWFLPPRRAAWIQAGVVHQVRAQQPISLRTIYLNPKLDPLPGVECCVFEVTPLAREMILFGMRWGPEQGEEALAEGYFSTLAGLCGLWGAEKARFCLPVARSAELERAMRFALERLEEGPTLHDAARVAFVSPRTLNRRFQVETGTTWREFIHAARMIQAMELLAGGDVSVTEVAARVGFDSPGAFTKAFRAYTGELPSAFRRHHAADDGAP